MMVLFRIRISFFFGCILLFSCFTAQLAPASDCAECDQELSLLERRPCGPDSIKGPLRYLFYQGCAGADFRAACRRHDACYDTVGSIPAECDREFLDALLAECPNSKWPAHARFRAYLAYWAVSIAGRPSWEAAQMLALRKLDDTFLVPHPTPSSEKFTGIFAGLTKHPLFAK